METKELNFIKSLAKSFNSPLPIVDKTIACIDNKIMLSDLQTFVTLNKKLWDEGIYNVDGTFTSIDVKEYPNLPKNPTFKIGVLPVNNMLSEYIPYCAKGPLRPSLECVYFDLGYIVATDAHRLRFDKHNMKLKSTFLLPTKPAKILNRLMKFYKQPVTIKQNDKHLFFICPGFTMAVRKIVGYYPNYKGVLPDSNKYTVKLVFPIDEITEAHKAHKKANKEYTFLKFYPEGKECHLTDTNLNLIKVWKLDVIKETAKDYNRLLMPEGDLGANIASVNILKTDTLYINPDEKGRAYII